MPTDPTTIALASLAVGLVIGTIIGRTLSGATKQRRTLTEELRQKDEELKTYQHKVTDHFITTSELVNNLTHSYKEVHQHLAASAMTLTNPEVSNKLLEAGSGNLSISHSTDEHTIDSPQPPKDYTPDINGILDESYGLEKNQAKTSEAPSAEDSESHSEEEDPTTKVA
ncbi:MAG: YhcB family protein [Gammaproteobacteria bacterium]|nr:YhcB family protein [Gammaproteobacteria bacterium]MBQ0839713.1 YhcB family protein [Gammaproteobacteria bacterium]